MTTVPATVSTKVVVPNSIRLAHIVVTPPSSYTTGGIAIPLPAGFRTIRTAVGNSRSSTATALWTFDPATQKLLAHCTAAGATGFTEATAAGDLSAQVIDLVCFDWDEIEPVAVAAS
jgi:hypothetical protein